MRKLRLVVLSLIIVVASIMPCFGANAIYLYDPVSGQQIDGETGAVKNTVTVSSTVAYNTIEKMFVYTTSSSADSDVLANVYNGMVTTGYGVIKPGRAASISVYRDGVLVDPSEYSALKIAGRYVVRNNQNDKELFAFTVVEGVTNMLQAYKIPSAFYILSVRIDGEEKVVNSNTIEMVKDGLYSIVYKLNATGEEYTLNVEIDHTLPELEIIGVDEVMVANGPVTFGEQEAGSTLEVTREGKEVGTMEPLKVAGDYVAKYTDAAGNTSTYYFSIHIFLDGGAWIFVALAVIIIAGAFGFMLYSRKNMRVR